MNIKNLPKSLKMEDDFLITCLRSIRESVKKLWDNYNLVQHYTKHNLSHSERVIEKLGALLEDVPNLLNEHEQFILLASAYLHDIGMQSPMHAGLPKKTEYTINELEIIREKHNESSAKMILESIKPGSELSLGLDSCKDYVGDIATLSKYHRKLDINKLKETALAGEKIRLPLLVALLKLGDALDQDYKRVNMKILKLRDIPTQSKFYWWSHHYVKSVSIERGRIELFFWFPNRYRENKIIEAFRKQVEESIKNHFSEIYDILYRYGLRLYREPTTKQIIYESNGVLEEMPEDLEKFIQENKLKLEEHAKKVSERTGVTWVVDGVPYFDDIEVANCLSNVLKFAEEEKYLKAVKEIERGIRLTTAPTGKMFLLLNGGNAFYILGKLGNAKEYYEDVLRISEREKVREIYEDDALLARTAAIGNIGLIYRAKGELENALKYHQEALKIHREIGYKQGEASDLGNIGLIYSDKGDLENALKYHQEALKIFNLAAPQLITQTLINLATIYFEKESNEKGFEYLAKAISSSSSPEQFNPAFSALMRTIRNMIAHNDLEKLESIGSIYTSGIIPEENFVNFLKAIHEYTLYKKTSKKLHKRNFEEITQKLSPMFYKILNELIEVRL